ncbi:ABC transporter substrate-binding protein [Pseudomonas chlororaphis]|uniref:ABC transporter substrate-binding protein n=1 Tax=Pseudomonas chlororaphis TaxID=587753 RepID=UPI00406C5799
MTLRVSLNSLFRSSLALALALSLLAGQACAEATRYPLTVHSCNREVTFKEAPKHALSHDINMTQMMLALGLKSRMVGYSGISGWKAVTPEMRTILDGLPELAAKYPSVETLLDANVDFFFAGWDYGMRVGGDLTPQTLTPLGINVLELTESCAFVMKRPPASLDDTYNDLRNLGRIFDVQDRANQLIADMQQQVAAIQQDLPTEKPRVFLYDSGEDRAMTSGRLGMPQALIDAAGGRNILDDVEASWTRVNWETVVERNPQVIVIVDYSEISAEQKQQFLLNNKALQSVDAIRNQRFIVIPYVQATPGIDNVEAVQTLAKGFHGA